MKPTNTVKLKKLAAFLFGIFATKEPQTAIAALHDSGIMASGNALGPQSLGVMK